MKNTKSLVQEVIDNQIILINEDINTLSEEAEQLNLQVLDKDKLMYKSHAGKYHITRAKLMTILSAKEYLQKEIKLYQKAFSKDMIANIDYIFEVRKVELPPIIAEKIIEARLEIVRFIQSRIGENDYNRDIQGLKSKVEEVSKLAVAYPTLKIPKIPHETIKNLIYELNQYKGISVDGGRSMIDDETIKEIATTIKDAKRLPKGHDDFSDKMNLKMGWL